MDEEVWEGIVVDIGGFVDFFGYVVYEVFQDLDC